LQIAKIQFLFFFIFPFFFFSFFFVFFFFVVKVDCKIDFLSPPKPTLPLAQFCDRKENNHKKKTKISKKMTTSGVKRPWAADILHDDTTAATNDDSNVNNNSNNLNNLNNINNNDDINTTAASASNDVGGALPSWPFYGSSRVSLPPITDMQTEYVFFLAFRLRAVPPAMYRFTFFFFFFFFFFEFFFFFFFFFPHSDIVIGVGSVASLSGASILGGGSSNAMGGDIAKIEAEFRDLKEKYFREQVAKLKREIDEIKAGTHAEFVSQVAELEKSRNGKLNAANSWRQFKLAAVQNEFETDKKIAEDDFMEEKRQHRDRMINGVMERKKAISEEKNTMSLASDAPTALGGGAAAQRNKRTLRRRVGHEKEGGPTSHTSHALPQVRYMLSEQEAAHDVAAIRNAAVLSAGNGDGAGNIGDVSSIFVQGDVGVSRGVLRYHDISFVVGDNVTVSIGNNNDSAAGSQQTWSGSIVFISPVEVSCRGVSFFVRN
jgi:hypothetical protein